MVTAFSVAMVPQSHAFAFGEAQVDEEYSVSLADSQTDTSYTKWLSSWNQTNYDSVTNVVLTPGSNLASLNFSWYAKTGTTPAVALSTKPDFSDARFFSGTSTAISRSTGTSTYSGAQHVSVQDALVPGKNLTITGSPMSRQASFLYGPLPTLIPFRQKTISHSCWPETARSGPPEMWQPILTAGIKC